MNRKRVFRISLVVVLILMLGALWTALQGGPLARSYAKLLFQQNRTDFDSAAAQAVEQGSGQGIPHPFGVRDVTLWDYGGTAVDFSMGSSGIGSSTTYWGIQGPPQHTGVSNTCPPGSGWAFRARGWRAGFPTGTAGAGRRAAETTAVTSRSWTSAGTTMRWNFRGRRS